MTQSIAERVQTLSFPDITRDDIARSLSGLPTPDLSGIERPTIDLPSVELPSVDLKRIELPRIDVSETVLGVASAVGLRRAPRPRWQVGLGIGALVMAGTLVALNQRGVRARIESMAWSIRREIARRRWGQPDEAVAFTSAATAPIRPSDVTGETGADYPDGLGSGSGPAFEDVAPKTDRSTEAVGV